MITLGHRWGHPNENNGCWRAGSFHSTSQEGVGATFSKLPHQVCPESMLPLLDSEANPHHHLSRGKEGHISPCHTSQAVLLPASLAAQAFPHSSVLRHTDVSLGITHHKYGSSCATTHNCLRRHEIQ